MRRNASGFTLIELLVVIGILSLLMVTLLPNVLAGRQTADIFADQANLSWHYTNIEIYKTRKHKWPKRGGANFVLAPWVMQIVERTPENRDRYFTPGKQNLDPRWLELSELDPQDIWRSFDEITSDDTQYAGRSAKHYRTMFSGKEALMANDNQYDNTFQDGTINVLMGSGSVRTLYKAEQLKEFWNEDDPNFVLEVGPNSPVDILKKLEK